MFEVAIQNLTVYSFTVYSACHIHSVLQCVCFLSQYSCIASNPVMPRTACGRQLQHQVACHGHMVCPTACHHNSMSSHGLRRPATGYGHIGTVTVSAVTVSSGMLCSLTRQACYE